MRGKIVDDLMQMGDWGVNADLEGCVPSFIWSAVVAANIPTPLHFSLIPFSPPIHRFNHMVDFFSQFWLFVYLDLEKSAHKA